MIKNQIKGKCTITVNLTFRFRIGYNEEGKAVENEYAKLPLDTGI